MTNEADVLSLAEGEWVPIPRLSRVIPFGYKIDPEDPNTLLPIPLELEALEQAKKHVKRFSYRDIANWITAITGRSISHVGLKKRLDIELNRRRKASTIKGWSARLKDAEARVETLEQERLGAKSRPKT